MEVSVRIRAHYTQFVDVIIMLFIYLFLRPTRQTAKQSHRH